TQVRTEDGRAGWVRTESLAAHPPRLAQPEQERPVAARAAGDLPELHVVATFPDYALAEMWAQRLRTEGIPVMVVAALPGISVTMGPHQLRVRAQDRDAARRLLTVVRPHHEANHRRRRTVRV